MATSEKKSLNQLWNEVFEAIKENFSAEIKTDGKLPHLIGKANGKDFIVKPSKNAIDFSLQVESDFDLTLSHEGWLKNKKDINIGVKDFDTKFIIVGEPVEKVIEFLSFETIRDAILCFEPIKYFKVDKSSITIHKKILRPNEISLENIEFLINRLGDFAVYIEKPEEIEEEKPPKEVFQKKVEEITKGSDRDRIEELEIKLRELEKRLKVLEEK